MGTVNRTVFVDQPEPSPLSLRVPAGQETRLAVRFLDRVGQVVGTDLLAQLELIGRSGSGGSQTYGMPSIDMAAGKAGALIPAGVLTDPNGYRLNLYGTRDGGAALLATGKVDLTAATSGPLPTAVDVIDRIDLTFTIGHAVELDVTLWADLGKDYPFNLTTASVSAVVLSGPAGTLLVPMTVAPLAANAVRLSLTAPQVGGLPALCWWALRVTEGAGVTTLCEGEVTVGAT